MNMNMNFNLNPLLKNKLVMSKLELYISLIINVLLTIIVSLTSIAIFMTKSKHTIWLFTSLFMSSFVSIIMIISLLIHFVDEEIITVIIDNKTYRVTYENSDYMQLEELDDNGDLIKYQKLDKNGHTKQIHRYRLVSKDSICKMKNEFISYRSDEYNLNCFKKLKSLINNHLIAFIVLCILASLFLSFIKIMIIK